jgi:hypothetical protein
VKLRSRKKGGRAYRTPIRMMAERTPRNNSNWVNERAESLEKAGGSQIRLRRICFALAS